MGSVVGTPSAPPARLGAVGLAACARTHTPLPSGGYARALRPRWPHAVESAAPIHLLVVPKHRYASILGPTPEILGEMLDLARSAARQQGVAESGFRIIINTNPHGSQTVYHLHMHVKGGHQLREPLLPYLWGRLTHLWHAA